ncbi:MAG: 1-acyl-sn-glycerol-3-phosphate acyltransferase [Myxococcota bacterium]|nr:1-acyl-sn-glycerol-3-phosphate acyltransferase [Myxococcota bacterium]
MNIFFRSIEVGGLENIPTERGGLLVAWHPNGMIDPALILGRFPYTLVFAARHGLFQWPGLGSMMRSIGAVPMYRKRDLLHMPPTVREQKNQESLDSMSMAISAGRFSAIFPEGVSHDSSFVRDLKLGAARVYYRSRMFSADGVPPVIIPVGLHYDKKHAFGSNVLVVFHPPISLPKELDITPPDDEQDEDKYAREVALTEHIEKVLTEVVLSTESWDLHFLFFRASKLIHAERAMRAGRLPSSPTMKEQVLGMARIWTGYQHRNQTHEPELQVLRTDLSLYISHLDSMGIEDHQLDLEPDWLTFRIILQLAAHVCLLVFVLPPFLVLGYIINYPTAFILNQLAESLSERGKDIASVKTFGGVVLFPLTWLRWSLLSSWGYTQNVLDQMSSNHWAAFFLSFIFCVFSGLIVLNYTRFFRRTFLAIRLRFTKVSRSTQLARMRKQRSLLYDQIIGLSQGLELPEMDDFR